MAQDFGDDVGDLLFRGISSASGRALRYMLQDRDGRQPHAHGEGAPAAETLTTEEHVCVPFGKEEDAAYFARVLRDGGVAATALTDSIGNGYVQFALGDLGRIRECVPQYAELMTEHEAERIVRSLGAAPLSEASVALLRESTLLDGPERPERDASPGPRDGQEASHDQEAPRPANHTQAIADKVRDARERCMDFDDFERLLAEGGIGIGTTKDGENLFYEARMDRDGRLLPYGRDESGLLDWSVGANTLKKNWGVDATHDWFERKVGEPQRPEAVRGVDGALDMDGATPSLDQEVKSHDSMDTDERTARIEREAHGTDVAPSKVREAQEYSLQSEARDMRAASKQLSEEQAAPAREIGLADRFSQVR